VEAERHAFLYSLTMKLLASRQTTPDTPPKTFTFAAGTSKYGEAQYIPTQGIK
jgi:hypothetical protein